MTVRLITTAAEDAQAAAYDDREKQAEFVLRVAVIEAIAWLRAGCPGRAEFALTRAGMSAERILGTQAVRHG